MVKERMVVGRLLMERGLTLFGRTTAAGVSKQQRKVGLWLLGTAGMVGGMVHVGGMTRLTKSGLSMTDWKPFGSLPPITLDEWMVEFERYKTFPEWQQRKSMTLDEFQTIYYWEWGHRMMGRTVGLIFTIPWLYFSWRRGNYIPRSFQPKLAGLWTLGGLQGLVGWWMVQSGLGQDRLEDSHEIRVQPQRLATHLAMAFTTYSALVYTGLSMLQHNPQQQLLLTKFAQYATTFHAATKPHVLSWLRRVRVLAIGTTALTFGTVVSGALVAGNDAGRAYNVFPHMMPDGQWLPPTDELFQTPHTSTTTTTNNKYSWMTHSTAYVQLQHRLLGITTATCGIALATAGLFLTRSSSASRWLITPQVKFGLYSMGGIAISQASLGIVTLLQYVPLPLAATHQLGSLALLTSGLFTVHSMRYLSPRLLRVGSRISSTTSSTPKSSLLLHNNTTIRPNKQKQS